MLAIHSAFPEGSGLGWTVAMNCQSFCDVRPLFFCIPYDKSRKSSSRFGTAVTFGRDAEVAGARLLHFAFPGDGEVLVRCRLRCCCHAIAFDTAVPRGPAPTATLVLPLTPPLAVRALPNPRNTVIEDGPSIRDTKLAFGHLQ